MADGDVAKEEALPKDRFEEGDFVQDSYDFSLPKKGRAVIINNINFTKASPRAASDEDGKRVKGTLGLLEFDDFTYKEDVTTNDLYSLLMEYSKKEYRDYSSFLCVIMTHGNEYEQKDSQERITLHDLIIGSDDKPISLYLLTELFHHRNCPSLKGKPKIFIIQACRGNKVSDSVQLDIDRKTAYRAPILPVRTTPLPREVPVYTDFLLAYPTQPGFYSFKDGYPTEWKHLSGTWFIMSIYDEMKKVYDEKSNIELLDFLRRVSRSVAYKYTSNCPGTGLDSKKEMPWIACRLTKKILIDPVTQRDKHGCVVS